MANVSADTAYSAAAWTIQESDDNSTFTAVAAEDIIEYKPKDLATVSKVFHAGCRSKKRYVKAAFDDGAAATGQITAPHRMKESEYEENDE